MSYKAECIIRLTLPDGKVMERKFSQEDTDLENLQISFVETVFARASTIAESMFEALEKGEEPAPEAAPPKQLTAGPPIPQPQKEGKKPHGKRKNKGADGVDRNAPAERPAEAAGTVEPGPAEKPAPEGEAPAGAAAGAGTTPA